MYKKRYEDYHSILLNCPASLEPMDDPMVLHPSGHSIEKASLEHMRRHPGDGASARCPATRQEITASTTNIALRQMIERVWERIEKLYDEMMNSPVPLQEVSVFRDNLSVARGESGEPPQKKQKN